MIISKKQRRRLRSKYVLFRDMKPRIFSKLVQLLPHVLAGIPIPEHYGVYK